MSFTYDAYISYAPRDHAWAERVSDELVAKGFEAFVDTGRSTEQAEWDTRLQGAIEASRNLVVLWSDEAAGSGWVTKEIMRFRSGGSPALGLHEKRRVIPVYLSGDNHELLAKWESIYAIRETRAYPVGPAAVPAATWREVIDKLAAGIRQDAPGVSKPQPGVFISYRREDTGGHAGRLFDTLTRALGEHQVFMDLSLPPGVDFVQAIEEAIGGCRVVLAVLGPRWAQAEDADDFVHLEIRAALKRPEVELIPVLVAEEKMPRAADLPEDIASFAYMNALSLDHARWKHDTEKLIDAIRPALAR